MKPHSDPSENYSNLEDDATESSGFFAIGDPSFSAINRDSREGRLGQEWALRDIREALSWLIDYDDDELLSGNPEPLSGDWEAPFPLLFPRGHFVLFEEAAARLMKGAFGGDDIQAKWEKQSFVHSTESLMPPIREIEAIIVQPIREIEARIVRAIPHKKSKKRASP